MTKQDILNASGDNVFFTVWLDFQLSHEDVTNRAGQVICEDVAGDNGGRTFAGVDQSSHPRFPFGNPKPSDVIAAYLQDWNLVRAGELPGPLGAVVANYGVNCGSDRAVKLLQEALGVEADGDLGPVTMAAVGRADAVQLSLAVVDKADAFYRYLAAHGDNKFLRGWLNRNNDLRAFIAAHK
jgi:lysozyme family protein